MKKLQIPNRFGLRILSLFLAFIAWLFVTSNAPENVYEMTLTFDIVPDWETADDKVVTGITSEIFSVTVRGRDDVMRTLTGEDIQVALDLTDYEPGKHTIDDIRGHMTLPSRVRLIKVHPDPIEVVIENWREQAMPVTFRLVSDLPDSKILKNANISPSEVILKGAESKVSQVKEVVAVYNYSECGTYEEHVELTPLDSHGNIVEQVSVETVTVSLELLHVKEVPLNVDLVGELPEGSSLDFKPATIRVKGSEETVTPLVVLLTEQITVEDLQAAEEGISVQVVFPEGVQPLASKNVEIQVKLVSTP